MSEENASNKENAMSDENGMDEEVAASEENAISEESATTEENAVAASDSLPPKASNRLKCLCSFLLLPFRALRWLIHQVFGELFWRPPYWTVFAGRGVNTATGYARHHPARTIGAVLALTALMSSCAWWVAQPKPPEPLKVVLTVKNPDRTDYRFDQPTVSPLRISFSIEVAALDSVNKEVASEQIAMSPPLAGKWKWDSSKVLTFLPETDWPVDSKHTVTFSPKMFRPEARFDSYKTTFQTARFEAQSLSARFDQHPESPEDKRVVASINFTHPVDTADFEKRVSLMLEGREKGQPGSGGEKKTAFEVSFDNKKLNAYVRSAMLPIPKKAQTMRVTVGKGVRAAAGGNGTNDALTTSVFIPGLDGLKVNDLETVVATNEKYQPEQVLILRMSMLVHEQQAKDAVKVWLLPSLPPEGDPRRERLKADQSYHWSSNDIRSIDPNLLKTGEVLKPEALPGENEVTDTFSYRYQAPPGRYIFVQVPKGLKAFGGHYLADDVEYVFQVPAFPPVAQIMAQGSLLSLSGERKLSVMARDVPAIRYSISRVLPQQLQYLVNRGLRYSSDFSNPSLDNYYNSVEEFDIAERFEKVVEFPALGPGKPQYQALDLTEYLGQAGKMRRGVFLLRVQGYDPKTKQVLGDQDSRLVMVSDLGLIEKKNVDGSHDLFVQSIHRGG
ncbi:MAG: hypothetical protein FWH56_12270, partial [Betaproteobacteria bacterium]|nr:hypothetical protein [Betaproteobacteria bacterium]